ncbi:MAG: sugar phosphate nucleotidyltransferase, partial [Gammaproteobacteria bacterium]|nr:sugar phosphate nucleotidyltransferase [Gammaproteobacteria bacterium]
MKTIILAGGRGVRMGGVTRRIPKPLVEIGGTPMLLHIMRHYEAFGFREFIVALGYLGEMLHESMRPMVDAHPKLQVDFVPTGLDTATGGRIKRLAPYIGGETFMLTWGDGLSNVDLHELLDFHRAHGRLATVT